MPPTRPRPGCESDPPESSAAAAPAHTLPLGERFRKLHAYQRTITSDLSLTVMTRQIAEAVADVVGVRAVLIFLLDPERAVQGVTAHGLDREPASQSLLDAESPEQAIATLRASGTYLAEDEICVAGTPYAHLIAADPVAGMFTAEDRSMFDALTRSAGSALEHATLFQRARTGARWLHASGEIARAMLAEAEVDTYTEIVARALEAADADYGHLVVPTEDGRLTVLAAYGPAAADHLGLFLDPDQSDLTRAVVNGKSMRAQALQDHVAATYDNTHRLGPFMLGPLLDAMGTRGSVLLTRYEGSHAFTDADLTQFTNYAAQVALAMQFADAREDNEQLRQVEARANASRELSDIIMQRLFAVGLGLDTLSTHLTGTVHHAKLERHILDLDETIEEIRQRVFAAEGSPETVPVRFPRILLPSRPTGRSRRQGRRRSDWQDGSGTARD